MSEFFMGCDVSKGYADFIVLNHREEVMEKDFQFDDTADGHTALVDFLTRFFGEHENATLRIGVESTGGYENNWFALFVRLGEVLDLKVTRLNPLAIKAHHEASMRRIVTDDISALNIASYLIAYRNKVTYQQDNEFCSLRKQWNFTELLKKQKTQLSNQLGFMVYQSHPEIVRYCKDGIPQWVMLLLGSYPTAARLAKAKAKSVAKIPFVSTERAESLITDAKKSVAAHVDDTDGFLIKETVRQIMALDTAIDAQKERMEKTCAIPEINLLYSIPGIGIYSAIGLMINIVSVARFAKVKNLTSYFGLHPVYRQSGDGMFGIHMSKKGRVEPRAILYMAVLSALSCNPLIKSLYEKHMAEGMKKKAAIGVCMHKMLRIIYGMLRTQVSFDPAVDEINRKKILKQGPTRHQQKKRRFQDHDKNAPISKRQTKKRTEIGKVEELQKNNVLEYGVILNPSFEKNIFRTIGMVPVANDPVRIGVLVEQELRTLEMAIHD